MYIVTIIDKENCVKILNKYNKCYLIVLVTGNYGKILGMKESNHNRIEWKDTCGEGQTIMKIGFCGNNSTEDLEFSMNRGKMKCLGKEFGNLSYQPF